MIGITAELNVESLSDFLRSTMNDQFHSIYSAPRLLMPVKQLTIIDILLLRFPNQTTSATWSHRRGNKTTHALIRFHNVTMCANNGLIAGLIKFWGTQFMKKWIVILSNRKTSNDEMSSDAALGPLLICAPVPKWKLLFPNWMNSISPILS